MYVARTHRARVHCPLALLSIALRFYYCSLDFLSCMAQLLLYVNAMSDVTSSHRCAAAAMSVCVCVCRCRLMFRM